jgi:hypothetical protein
LNADGLHVIERMIAIAEQIARRFIPGERIAKLLHGPRGSGMLRDVDMHNAPAIMGEEHQDEQQPARRRRDDEEVGRDRLVCVIGQKRPPGLRGEWPSADQVLGDSRLRDAESQFQQLTVNWGAPQSGFATDIVRISVRTSRVTVGRPVVCGGSSTSRTGGIHVDATR